VKHSELQPVRDTPEDYDEIERRILEFLKEEIYEALVADIGATKSVLRNSLEDLEEAIAKGTVSFDRGKFDGKFTARTSKELKKLGAKWKNGKWAIHISSLPSSVQEAIRLSEARFKKKMRSINEKLDNIDAKKLAEKLNLEDLFDTSLFKMEKSLDKSVKNITVMPKLTDEQRRFIAREYSDSLKLPIQKWTENQVKELRKKMNENVFGGDRYEGMVKVIQDSYGVGARKAKFLARQETNLLMAKFKQTRYASVGVNEYKWRSVVGTPNHPTRPRHKALNDASAKGKIFRFDDPPNTAEPGDPPMYANPGESWNCRCTAIPVVRF